MEKLNVCLVNDSFPPAIDGVANAVTNYAEVISSGLGKASVVTPFYPDADDGQFPFEVIRYPSVDTTKLVGYRAGMPFSPWIMARLENSGFDIIHTHCPIASTLLARTLRDRIQVPLIFTYHTKFDIEIDKAIRSKILREGAANILVENISACDEVWAVSRGAGENLRSLGYEGDYVVMPNGVDFPKGRVSEEEIAAATEGYDLPEGVPVFLFVGRMMWYKGLRIILEALKILKDSGADFRMVFIGGGGDKAEIEEFSHSLALDAKVTFVDPIHDRSVIRAWYCRADMFLFPSTFDTNGLVVREAAACALGSVLVGGSCAAEDSTDGVDGILIEENAASMAEALKQLCANPGRMKELGEMAQKNLYMSWEESVTHAYERYGIVLENYRAGKYAEHRKMTDDFFHTAAEALDGMIRMDRRRENLRAELNTRGEELNENRERLETVLKTDRNRLESTLKEESQRALDNARCYYERVRENIAAGNADAAEQMEAFWQSFERFR